MRKRTDEHVEGRADGAPDPERIEEGFDRRAAEFAAAARRVRSGSDPEAIHDLRVATRRLIAAMRLWRDLVPARARRAAERGLRRLRRRIGRARELEVHVALLEERLPARGGAGPSAAVAVLERLRERLARRRRSAARRVSPRRLKRVLRRIEVAGAGLGARRHGATGATRGPLAVERKLAAEALAALRCASEQPEEVALHDARVLVKKWRYTLECLGEAVPGVALQAVRPLRRIQGELGDAHDRALLREVLDRQSREADPGGDEVGLGLLMGRLEQEREGAVARFRRLAGALVGLSRDVAQDAALEASADGRIEAPAEPIDATAAAGTVVVERADAGTAGHEAADHADGREDPRDERWDRMATWLALTGRRS